MNGGSVRILFLPLLFALSLAAYADSIDYSGAGSLADHTASQSGAPSAGRSWSVTSQLVEINDTTTGMITQGVLGHVDITTGRLASCTAGLCFTGGSLDITNTSGGVIFDMAFTSGSVSKSGGNTFLNASLVNGGTTQIESSSGVFSSNSIVSTSAGVAPEPSALWLLGTGLIGLSFARRFLH